MGGPGKGKGQGGAGASASAPGSPHDEGKGPPPMIESGGAAEEEEEIRRRGEAGEAHDEDRRRDEAEDSDDGDDGDDDEDSEAAPGDDAEFFGAAMEQEEGANDMDDDDMGFEAQSPFGPETFRSAAACWRHAAARHGFSLAGLRARLGDAWTDYHRIRLVNYLRSLGPEEAQKQAPLLGPDSGHIWEDEALLMPVLEDDPLLFDEEDDGDNDDGAGELGGGSAPCGGHSGDQDALAAGSSKG